MCVMAVHVPKTEDEAALGGPKFHPPLYKQRYNAVLEVARRLQAKRVSCHGLLAKWEELPINVHMCVYLDH